MRGGTAAAWEGGPLRLLRKRNPPPRLRAPHPHPARLGAAPASLAALASHRWRAGALRAPFSRSWPAAISAAPACRCSRARPGKAASRRLRRWPSASLAWAVRARRSRRRCSGQKRPVPGLGLFWPSAFAGRASARPAATPLHWPARVAAPRPCASRRAGPGGCPACGPGRACGPRIFNAAHNAGVCASRKPPAFCALRARRLRGCISPAIYSLLRRKNGAPRGPVSLS